jgi:hypothetical protein
MKRTLLLAILGIAASVASSYGQGSFFFSIYAVAATSTYAPVRWMNGQPVVGGSNIVANLVYSFTGTAGFQTVNTGLAVPLSVIPGYGDGWIDYGTALNLPSTYPNSGGPGPALTMSIFLSGTYLGFGVSAETTWIEPGFTQAPGQLFQAYPGNLTIGPEPGTLSLLGLGAGSLLLLRKRSQKDV